MSMEPLLVSVVMVTYGGKQWIPLAVEALAAHTEAPYELIVVDNASPPDTVELVAGIPGATAILNDHNVGFGPGANQGVLHATGRFVCLLNSDAFVEPGWLPPLIKVLESDPSAGAVVPKLLHLDGTLQEAGGVVGCDGSTRALGDGDDAEALPYRFRRYVDYGSAACLLMRRSTFAEVGGFDPAYPLGYCEDVDLCFALAERGLRTVYEPRSRVRHVRWGSSSRVEAEQRVFANQPILLARWRERLAGRPSFAEPPFRAHDILQARDADALDRILIVTDGAWGWPAPVPARVAGMAAGIARHWPDSRVTLLAGPAQADTPEVARLLQAGVEVAAEDRWEGWFEERRFHYSVAIVPGPAAFERFDPLISATQPQATRVYDLERPAEAWAQDLLAWWPALRTGPTGTLPGRLGSLEAWGVESADVVTCAGEAALELARRVAPGTPSVLVPGLVPGPLPPGLPAGAAPEWGKTAGPAIRGTLPAGPRFGGLQPAGGAEMLAPQRWILDELEALVPGAAGSGDLPARPRVILVPPPLAADAGTVAAGIPFVTWGGGAAGLALGDLWGLLVGDSPAAMATLAADLLRDRSLWENVREGLERLARRSQAEEATALWSALAHCGFGAPSPPGRSHRAAAPAGMH